MGTVLVRVGLPASTGALVTAAEKIGAPVLISANSLWEPAQNAFRQPGLRLDGVDAALDSAGFVAMRRYGGYPWSVQQYVEMAGLYSWAWWAQQDLCCEPEIARDDAEVLRRVAGTADLLHQNLLWVMSLQARGAFWITDPMPVLQGWKPDHYRRSLEGARRVLYVLGREWPKLVGVGSVCRRAVKGEAGILAVLSALDGELPPDTRLHLFGVKGTALPALREHPRVCSIDSMAWDFGARMDARKAGERATMGARCAALQTWFERNATAAGHLLPEVGDLLDDMPSGLAAWTRAHPAEANARYLLARDRSP